MSESFSTGSGKCLSGVRIPTIRPSDGVAITLVSGESHGLKVSIVTTGQVVEPDELRVS